MRVELKVPEVGESIREVQISAWRKVEGQWVEKDEPLVELETDKATVDLPAPAAGVLAKVLKPAGETVGVGEVIGHLDPEAAPQPTRPKPAGDGAKPQPAAGFAAPAAERVLKGEEVASAASRGRPLKEDVLRHTEERRAAPAALPPAVRPPAPAGPARPRLEEAVPMSLIRRRIAQRLVEAQHTAALLTTFNEIDMSAIVALRRKHREAFESQYGVKLGVMSFFVKAAIESLKAYPELNAEIRGDDIVYRNYYDIGVAVSGGKGLVVPVLHSAERMSFAEIERAIGDFAARAQSNRLSPEELAGGTFTITNGGVFGSLLSTPIVNPPQSGILGMHAIQDRPVAREGQVVIRPMMYVALTYDHRIVDGREAVGFLRRVKELIEEPVRLVLEV